MYNTCLTLFHLQSFSFAIALHLNKWTIFFSIATNQNYLTYRSIEKLNGFTEEKHRSYDLHFQFLHCYNLPAIKINLHVCVHILYSNMCVYVCIYTYMYVYVYVMKRYNIGQISSMIGHFSCQKILKLINLCLKSLVKDFVKKKNKTTTFYYVCISLHILYITCQMFLCVRCFSKNFLGFFYLALTTV